MSVTFRPAKRENAFIIAGIAGPSGSGKTMSALLLAKGLAGGKPFAVIDTERGRALHYADDFDFLHAELDPPFSPQAYMDAIKTAPASAPVIVIDSASHEHAGEGGVLDMHEAELQRMAGDDYKRREAMKFAAWIDPKKQHKRWVSLLLQEPRHVILCLRAEEKIDLVKNPETGKLEVKPKRTLAGHVGWIPICGKDLPYELTLSLVVTPDAPGVPHPIKLQEQHRPLVPLDKPLSEETGQALAAWAAGGSSNGTAKDDVGALHDELVALVHELGATDALPKIEEKTAAGDKPWLKRQIATARKALQAQNEEAVGQEAFPIPESAR